MALMERPLVTALSDGGKSWEHEYEKFYLKAYVPATKIDGQVNNYTFRAPLLRKAYEQPYCDAFTDDASVVEALGHAVQLVEGNRENIKLTTPFDLIVARALVQSPSW